MWICGTRFLMLALLPKGDEFRMNFEGLGVVFRHICYVPQHFFEWGVSFAEKGRPHEWGIRSCIGLVLRGLAYGEP